MYWGCTLPYCLGHWRKSMVMILYNTGLDPLLIPREQHSLLTFSLTLNLWPSLSGPGSSPSFWSTLSDYQVLSSTASRWRYYGRQSQRPKPGKNLVKAESKKAFSTFSLLSETRSTISSSRGPTLGNTGQQSQLYCGMVGALADYTWDSQERRWFFSSFSLTFVRAQLGTWPSSECLLVTLPFHKLPAMLVFILLVVGEDSCK